MVRWFRHPLAFILLLGTLLALSWSLWQSWQRRIRAETTLQQLHQEVDTLQLEVQDLSIQASSSAQTFEQEKIIRDELLLQLPGESVLQLPTLDLVETETAPVSTPYPWQAWWKLISS